MKEVERPSVEEVQEILDELEQVLRAQQGRQRNELVGAGQHEEE